MTPTENEDTGWSDQYDLAKHHTDVHSKNIKKDITNDYTLAKFNEKDKEGIVNMTDNAYRIKQHFKDIAEEATTCEYNPKTHKMEPHPLDQKEKDKIIQLGERAFAAIMKRCDVTAVVNRNVANNYLARNTLHTSDFIENDESTTETEAKKTLVTHQKDKLQRKVEKEERGE